MKTYYRTALPHIQPKGAMFFVTFRLHGSIPRVELVKWENEYKKKALKLGKIADDIKRNLALFKYRKISLAAYDLILHDIKEGHYYLQEDAIMTIVRKELHRFDGELYDLIAYCIMKSFKNMC